MNRLPVMLAVLLSGCGSTVSRPEQSNFTIHASREQAERLVQTLSRQLDASADAHELDGLGNDPSRIFRLDGANATLVIAQVPDDRCNPNAPRHSTFNEGEYRIDLVYRSSSEAARNSARRTVIQSARDEGLTITDFKGC